jgi:hypothetical protein
MGFTRFCISGRKSRSVNSLSQRSDFGLLGLIWDLMWLGTLTPLVPGWGTGPDENQNPRVFGFALFWLLAFVLVCGTGRNLNSVCFKWRG